MNSDLPTLRILFVEDIDSDVELAKRALYQEGLSIDTRLATHEPEFVAAMREFAPDIVISDYAMPTFNGMRALELAQEHDPGLPVIILTGSTTEEIAVELMKAGAWDYVLKSGVSRLPFAVRSVLERRDAERNRAAAEAALRDSEERYRLLMEFSGVGLAYLSVDGRVLWLNRTAAQYVTGDVQSIKGKTLAELGIEWNHPEFYRRLEVAAASDGGQQYEDYLPYLRTPCWIRSIFTRIVNAQRELQGVQIIFHDLTARKQMEEQSRISESLLQKVFDLLPVGLWFADEHGKVVRQNPAGTRIWGTTDLGIPLEDRVYKARRLDTGEEISPEDWGLVRSVNEGVTITDELLEIDAYDGEKRIIINHAAPVLDDNGRIRGAVVVNQDVTASKRAEREREALLLRIREQAEQLEQVMRTVPEGVMLLDAENRVVLANPRAQGDLVALAGAAPGDRLSRLGDRSLQELLAPPPRGLWHEIHAGGRFFEAIARKVDTGPTPAGWVLVLRDVSRERQLQEHARQQERLAAVGQLAAGVAHDFNNILGVITLYAGLSRRDPSLSPAIAKRLATIDEQAMCASQLVQQILDFSRRSVLERLPVDLVAFLKESVQLLRRTLPESIGVSMRHGQGSFVGYADPTRLQQALFNLATNARDAMPDGGDLLFELDIVHPSGNGHDLDADQNRSDWIRLRATDTGEGVSPENVLHLFEPFFTTKERGRGTGLGLAQVYGIVKQHEGEISVESEVGKGTTFTILLPSLPASSSSESAVPPYMEAQGNGETLLLVEDNQAMRTAMSESLELLNYRVLAAGDSAEALRIYRDEGAKISVVISDYVMPVMGGRQLFRELQKLNPQVRVVILTGHPMEQELSSLEKEGLVEWLQKPASPWQLSEVVAAALAGHPAL